MKYFLSFSEETEHNSGNMIFNLGEIPTLLGIGFLTTLTTINLVCLMANVYKRKPKRINNRKYSLSANEALPRAKGQTQDRSHIMMTIQECEEQDVTTLKRKECAVELMEAEEKTQAIPNVYEAPSSHYKVPRSYD